MKRNWLKLAGVVIAMLAVGMTAQALPVVQGQITFEGVATLNDALPNATAFQSFKGVHVANNTQTGSFVGTDGYNVAMVPFTFLPSLNPDPVTQWAVTVGSTTYSFTLNSPLTVLETSSSLSVTGYGSASITGFESAVGFWSLSLQGRSADLCFSTTTSVPDGGTTVLLLGAALSAMGLFRKKLMA